MASPLNLVAALLTLAGFSTSLNASQEIISSKGVGVSDTKLKACEMALDYARRDAAQSATVQVESEFSSVASNSGAQHHEDRLVTTKAFARLVEKQESVSFDAESGLIRCSLSGSFKVGFVADSPEKVVVKSSSKTAAITQQGSQSTEVVAQDFKTGEPFCSGKMNLCFREIYSKQLGEFGIQVLPPGYWRTKYLEGIDSYHYSYFFNKVSNRPSKGKVVSVTTKKALLDLIDKKDELAYLYVNKHTWSGIQEGFLKRSEYGDRRGYPYGKGFKPMMVKHQKPGIFDSLDVSEEYLEGLDDEMNEAGW
ncbi:MAG: hypothetical protein MK185_03430 [Saccharospirillaceae bacterium]|nr:hypothetical protein [Saccharospirillaceae bacterium]